jgi:hypothetical protein
MSKRVYLSGDVVVVDKVGSAVLNIPQIDCGYKIIGDDVTIYDVTDSTQSRTTPAHDIRDQANNLIGDLYDVIKYFSDFIYYGETALDISGGGGGGGEDNTASNVGTGEGIFKQKTGVDLEFKSLIAGSNITLTSGADDITIDAGAGTSFGYDKTKNAYYFAGTNTVDYAYRTNAAVNANVMNVIGFNIYGQVELESLSINSNASGLVANLIACVYKYDYATNDWTLVAQSTPYTTGISGFQTYTLPSTVSMENGLYFAGILSDANATNLSGIQANGLYNAFGYATTPLNLAAVDKWYKYNLTYTTTLPATISGYPTGFARQTSGNVAIPLLKFN